VLRQILVSLVVLAVAAAGYVYLVPGASEQLAQFGITLPVAAATNEDASTTAAGGERRSGGEGAAGGQRDAQAGGGGAGGFRAGGGRRGARELIVVTAPVEVASINDKLNAIGDGEAAHSVTVMSPANGTLVELLVKPGDAVAAGDIIGRLDADAEQIAVERAALALKDAEAALKRTQDLAGANAASTVQINTAQLALDNARLEIRNAELNLSRRTIVSPIAGTVGLFQVSPGNTVSNSSIVTTIEDTSHIVIRFWVPERYASFVATGMPVSVAVVALPGVTVEGAVSAVDNRIDPASRTLQVQAQIPNDGSRLRPGMSFSVAMTFPGEQFASVDPLSIQWSSEGSYVWRYADGKVDKAFVQIIQRNSDGILVKGDLAEGDQVVTQGVQQLSAGASVRLLDDFTGASGDRQGGGRETSS
jgi:RND family efflux transporter MFP subunit